MPLKMLMRPSGLLVPITDFGLEQLPERQLVLGDDIAYVAALSLGHNGKEPKLLLVDAAGNLRVTLAGATTPGNVRIQDGGGAQVAAVSSPADAAGLGSALSVLGAAFLWNGASFDRERSASAANIAALSGLGAAVVANPGEDAVTSNPAAGVAPVSQAAAGGAAVRRVCKSLSFGFSSQAALAGVATVVINLRDGATGAGTIKKTWTFDLPAAIIAPFALALVGLNIVGSLNTAMTLEAAAAVAGLRVFTNLGISNVA